MYVITSRVASDNRASVLIAYSSIGICFHECHRLLSQATAEQIRLAQMIYDKNDADFEDKVNQVSGSSYVTRQ